MDILDLYSRLKNSYKEYISSFVRIKDKRIEDVVTKAIHREKMWPKALIQFNPNYAKGIGIAKRFGKVLQYSFLQASTRGD